MQANVIPFPTRPRRSNNDPDPDGPGSDAISPELLARAGRMVRSLIGVAGKPGAFGRARAA